VQLLKNYISQGSVATRLRRVKICDKTVLSQIVRKVCQCKNFEKWSIFG